MFRLINLNEKIVKIAGKPIFKYLNLIFEVGYHPWGKKKIHN